jgi:hypothetical protein
LTNLIRIIIFFKKEVIGMKSMFMAFAIALASGLLVASGVMAGEEVGVTGAQSQQEGSRRQVDIMGPEYTTWDLDSAISAGQGGTQEMAPANASDLFRDEGATRRQVDIMGSEYTTWDLDSAISAGQGGAQEMAPATSSRPQVDIMEPSTQSY